MAENELSKISSDRTFLDMQDADPPLINNAI